MDHNLSARITDAWRATIAAISKNPDLGLGRARGEAIFIVGAFQENPISALAAAVIAVACVVRFKTGG
jgi:hypothetical protein